MAKKSINNTAKEYQELDRQMKALSAKMKPLKDELLQYADENREKFDDAFQIKFPNGTYIALRVADALEGTSASKDLLFNKLSGEPEMFNVTLNEKKVIDLSKKDNKLMKLLTTCSIQIGQKETMAVYAG